jgi:hypothetical protein
MDDTAGRIDAAARRICQETCAHMGEPACWSMTDVPGHWPNRNCDAPGCHWLAAVALDVEMPAELRRELEKRNG